MVDEEQPATDPRRMLYRTTTPALRRQPRSVLTVSRPEVFVRGVVRELANFGYDTVHEESVGLYMHDTMGGLEAPFTLNDAARRSVDLLLAIIYAPELRDYGGILNLDVDDEYRHRVLVVTYGDSSGHQPFADSAPHLHIEVPEDATSMARETAAALDALWLSNNTATRRREVLNAAEAGQLFAASESLMAEAQTVVDDEPAGVDEEDIEQLRHDIRLAWTALQSPRPDTVTVERALARISQVLQQVAPSPHEVAKELFNGGINVESAMSIGEDLSIVSARMSELGHEDEAHDIEVGRQLRAAVDRIDAAVSNLPEPTGPDGVDEKALIRDARLRGRVKFWSEVWPEQKAKVIGTATVAGTTAGVAATQSLGIPAALLRLAKTVVQTIFM